MSAATAARRPVKVNFRDVQGTVVQIFRRPIVRHLLLHFGEGADGRGFVRRLLPRVTMADRDLDVATEPLVNVGITYSGLEAVGVDRAVLDKLDAIYREGPNARPLGDAAGTRSDPAGWWEGQFATGDLHCVVHVFVATDEALATASAELRRAAREAGATELIPRKDGSTLDARSLGGATLHFGYTDGISQPDVCWDDAARAPGQVDFRNFLLGHATDECSSAPRSGPAAVYVRDGAYGAFRWLYQDVAAFNRYLRTEAPRLFGHLSQRDAEELLAAKMMGRWRNGAPLVLAPDGPDSTMATRNDFGYRDEDPAGVRCPFSAHIRVVNPRDQPLDPVVVEGVPSVLRRGLPYGPVLEGTQDDGVDRGVFGVFMCSDLRRQVYTLTGWIKRNDFSPVFDDNRRVQDALLGNRGVPGADPQFTIPAEAGAARVTGLPDFVQTKGTAFLLYPSRATLGRLAGRS